MYEKIFTAQHAQGIALKRVPGRVEKVGMDLVYGIMLYKFYILHRTGKRYLVEVDAKEGTILRAIQKRPDND